MDQTSRYNTRKANTQRRNDRVRGRVNDIYNRKRTRIDDVFKMVAQEFGLSEGTIRRIYSAT